MGAKLSSFLKLKIGFLLLDMINLIGLFSTTLVHNKKCIKVTKGSAFFKTLMVSEPESIYTLAIFKIFRG